MVTAGILDPLIGLLVGLAKFVGHWVLWALISAINLLVAAIGAVIGGFLSLLPDMPTAGGTFGGSWVGWLNYYIPVAELVAGLVIWVGLWLLYLVVRIPLRWVKAL